MGFIDNVIACTIGIGGCKIDTILNAKEVKAGEAVTGVFKISGGKVEQGITNVELEIKGKYEKEVDDKKQKHDCTIQKISIPINKVVQAGENFEKEFSFELDENCPMGTSEYPVWISSCLEIQKAVDDKDKDSLQVLPSENVSRVISVLEEEGFRANTIENSYVANTSSTIPFVQEIEFVPKGGEKTCPVDELKITFNRTSTSLQLLMHVATKASDLDTLLKESEKASETKVEVNITNKDLENVEAIRNLILENLK